VADSKTINLLIVEDDPEDEKLLSEALLEIEENRLWCNWRSSILVPVDRLADALDCLRRLSFDAILLNLSLPDSPSLLDTFFDIRAGVDATTCTGCAPILVLADEPDENLANRLLREGAQDVLVKSELDCAPLARAIRYAIERQRRAGAARTTAFVDHLTGVLTRDAFLTVAAHRGPVESVALAEISADCQALDPVLIQAAEALRGALDPPSVVGRWDRRRFCVLASDPALHRAAAGLPDGLLRFSTASIEDLLKAELLNGEIPRSAKTAILAD
jgi:PleD family two-component response regulator